MIAGLPMYDRAETANAHDALWAGIRDGLRAEGHTAPEALTRTDDLWGLWEDPALVLSQACNLPYRMRLHDRVTLIGSPDLALPDTPAGHYHSLFVVRRADSAILSDYAERRFVMNQSHSHSGWAAPQLAAAALGFRFTNCTESGGHRYSARAVATRQADIAAIDAHTWRALTAFDGDTVQGLEVIGRTASSPAPPYITAPGHDPDVLAAILERAITGLAASHHAMLGLRGLVRLPAADYLAVPTPPQA